jgi:hypothetical protein
MLKNLAIGLVLISFLTACAERNSPPSPTETGEISKQNSHAGDEKRRPGDSDIKATFNRQHDLLARAVAGVASSRPDVPEFFFVGFAGQASEDVFLNEARAAADLFRRRFGADGRTLLLANNAQTVNELPLASISGLRVAISEIAKKMGDEDILFLYLTSHGRRGRISVRYGRANLPDLRAGQLRRILDNAGIKNRVVAISACYSGSFIEPLRDENSLIMTAAASDRVSFGCGHDGTFTYFGQALIGEALENEMSFHRAFESAARSIENREKKEGQKPSRPQFFIGKAIGPVLERIERHLQENR